MASFAIICEGISENLSLHAIIEKMSQTDSYFADLQPRTEMSHGHAVQEGSGGWTEVLSHCNTEEFRMALQNNDYLVVQIDTDRCDEQPFGIKKFDETDDSCTATVYNPKTGEEITDTFTYRDAELSGFVKDSRGGIKLGWKPGANRKRKLRYAVLSQIIHTYLPEVLGSVAGIGDYSEDYIDAQNLDAAYRKEQENEKRAEKLERLQHLSDEPQEAEVVE